MPTSRARILVLAAGLAVAAPASEAGDPPPSVAPSALVANPQAEGWARFQPGAWVRMRNESVDTAFDTSPPIETLLILLELGSHEVVVWEGLRMPETAAGEYTGGPKLSDRKVSADEARGGWTGEPSAEKVTESTERIRAAGREFDCRVVDIRVSPAVSPLHRMRTWRHSDVPGGVVRKETEGVSSDRKVRRRLELVAFGSKPDGSFAYPPKIRSGDELVEAPGYAHWAQFPVGTWVQSRSTLVGGLMPSSHRTKERLVEVRPNRLFLQIDTFNEEGEAGGIDLPEVNEEVPVPGGAPPVPSKAAPHREEVLRRVPGAALGTNDKELGYTTTETAKGKETLEIAGRNLVCTVVEKTSVHETDPMKVRVKQWHHPDVPGGIVKTVVETTEGKNRTVHTAVVEAWGVPGK